MTTTRRLPAEWESQSALWLSWPVSMHIWPGKHEAIAEKFAEIAAAASRFQRVCINADAAAHVTIRGLLKQTGAELDHIELHDHPTNDVWCRDHGPIFVKEGDQDRITDWSFNAWGGKFEPWDLDNAVPGRIAESLGLPIDSRKLILEGGAIEVNGAGVMLTTEPVLLNPNRNQGITQADYETVFREAFGVSEVIWLPAELPNDDTDGHIDNLARFVAESTVLCVNDARIPALQTNVDLLKKRFDHVVEIPMPEPVLNSDGEELPASYANYVVLNDAVLTPAFAQGRDQVMIDLLQKFFPAREIVPIDCRLLLEEGGALHCISMNQWL